MALKLEFQEQKQESAKLVQAKLTKHNHLSYQIHVGNMELVKNTHITPSKTTTISLNG